MQLKNVVCSGAQFFNETIFDGMKLTLPSNESLLEDEVYLAVLNPQELIKFSDRLKNLPVVLLLNQKLSEKNEEQIFESEVRLVGLIDTRQSVRVNTYLLRNYFSCLNSQNLLQESDLDPLVDINVKIDDLLSQYYKQIENIKNLHKKIVPKRKKEFNNLTITSKYQIGENSGGDYFEFLDQDQKILIILSTSKSYLTSSLVISELEKIEAAQYSQKDFNLIIKNIWNDVDDLPKRTKDRIMNHQLMILEIDLNKLTYHAKGIGRSALFTSNKMIFEGSVDSFSKDSNVYEQSGKLERGHRYLIASPGMREGFSKNCFNEFFDRSSDEMLEELFIKLNEKKAGSFIENDATAILLEVDKNAISSL